MECLLALGLIWVIAVIVAREGSAGGSTTPGPAPSPQPPRPSAAPRRAGFVGSASGGSASGGTRDPQWTGVDLDGPDAHGEPLFVSDDDWRRDPLDEDYRLYDSFEDAPSDWGDSDQADQIRAIRDAEDYF